MATRVSRIVQDRGALKLFARRGACRVLLVALLAASMLALRPAAAQTVPAQSVPAPGAPAPGAPVPGTPAPRTPAPGATADGSAEGKASALMSATKATTYKLGTALTNMLILTAGTGVVGGAVLAAFVTGESWLVYGVNDYLWDTYAPKPPARPDGSFDAKESAWRATEKWLTYKPVVVAFKFGAIYAWTGSVSAMLVLGTVTAVANTGVFYANNIGWDAYEWWNTPVVPAPVVHADSASRATATP
jgi:uncharacterized membrane protein